MLRSIALGFGLLLATASVYAQEVHVRATIPFDFVVGNQALPAGDYTVQSMGSGSSILLVQNRDQKAATLVRANSCEKRDISEKTALVFHRVGDQYFLSEIWREGDAQGRQLPRSRSELEISKNQASEPVVIVATLLSR
ncbi:MAG TPA: hypothetical protein VLV88_05495 [Terriglobales bacterium]|nr:hypothetical protein [Terriglobales bacterium]